MDFLGKEQQSDVMFYPSGAVVLQLKHVHRVVDSAAIMVKLDITCQSLQPNLQTGDRDAPVRTHEDRRVSLILLSSTENLCLENAR